VEIDVRLPGTSKRTDAEIANAAANVLQWTTYLPRDAVKILVENGWITLSGEVTWDYQRIAVFNAVRYLLGVTGVSDQIVVKPKISVTVVKADIETAIRRRARSDAQNISVVVSGNDLTLTGKVHTWGERDLARHTAWNTPGVRNVFDNMTVSA
jgi:osmotically-inducible protein OsmY